MTNVASSVSNIAWRWSSERLSFADWTIIRRSKLYSAVAGSQRSSTGDFYSFYAPRRGATVMGCAQLRVIILPNFSFCKSKTFKLMPSADLSRLRFACNDARVNGAANCYKIETFTRRRDAHDGIPRDATQRTSQWEDNFVSTPA